MAQALERVPMGCVHNLLVKPVGPQEGLNRAHSGIAVDVNDVGLTDSLAQGRVPIIIMEQARADGRDIGHGQGTKLGIVLEQVVEGLAVGVGASRHVLPDV